MASLVAQELILAKPSARSRLPAGSTRVCYGVTLDSARTVASPLER
jgi:hypothetical protein